MKGLCWSYVPFNEWLLTQHNHCFDSDILCIPKVNRDTFLYQRPQLRLTEQEYQPFVDLFEKVVNALCPTCAHSADSNFDLFCPDCTTTYHENCINMSKNTFKCPLCNDPDVVTLANLRFKKRTYGVPKQKAYEVHMPNMSMHEWNNEDQLQSYSSDIAAIKSESTDFMGGIDMIPPESDEDEDIELIESEITVDFTKREIPMHIEKEPKKVKALVDAEPIKPYNFEKLNTSDGEVTLEKIFYKLELNPWIEGFTRNKIKAPDLLLLTEEDYESLLPIGPRRRLQAWLLGLRYFALNAEI